MNQLLHLSSKIAASVVLLAILIMPAVAVAQSPPHTFENFNMLTLGSSPGDGNFMGQNSVSWDYYNCRGDVPLTGKAITLGVGGATSSLTCYQMTSTIQSISFDYMQVGPNPATIIVKIGEDQVGIRTTNEQGTVVNSGSIPISTGGSGAVELNFITTEGGNEITIDNISWTVPPDNIETFTNLFASEDFDDGYFTGDNNLLWKYYQGRVSYMDGLAIELGMDGSLFCEDISAGMYSLNFDYIQTTSEAVELEIYINDEYITTISSDSYYTPFNTGNIIVDNASGEGNESLTFEIRNANYGEVIIDNVAWTNRDFSYTEFTGTGNWSDPSKWNNGIPNKNYITYIKGYATINEEATAHYVGVKPQGRLTVIAPEILISAKITVRADATGSGSLIASDWSLNINNANIEWHIKSGVAKA